MKKQHFIALADVVRGLKPQGDRRGGHLSDMLNTDHEQWERTKLALADFCQAQSPQFNRQRWLDYIDGKCGPSGGKPPLTCYKCLGKIRDKEYMSNPDGSVQHLNACPSPKRPKGAIWDGNIGCEA